MYEAEETEAEARHNLAKGANAPEGIGVTLSQLDEALDGLDGSLGRLGSRIDPLMRPEQDTNARPGDVSAIRMPASPVREHALRLLGHARHLTAVVDELHARIDL